MLIEVVLFDLAQLLLLLHECTVVGAFQIVYLLCDLQHLLQVIVVELLKVTLCHAGFSYTLNSLRRLIDETADLCTRQ